MDLSQLQAQEREFCDTLHSPCICRQSPTCIWRETSTKATSHADIFWFWLIRPLCRTSGLSSHLSDFCWLLSQLSFHLLLPPSAGRPSPRLLFYTDWFLLLSVLLFTWPCIFSGTFLSSSTSGLVVDLELKPFVLVSRQNRQRDCLTGTHTHIVSHNVEQNNPDF